MNAREVSLLTVLSGVAAFCLLMEVLSGGPDAASHAGEGADSFHCSFDSGWCGMQQDTHGDDFNWTRQSGATLTYNTGPDCDPLDCQSGVYAYIESSDPQRYRDTARLTTPLLHGDGSRCLEFFWHMYGEAMGNLTVILRQLNGSEVNLWFRSGPQGNQWHSAQVHIPDTPRFYKLVFEGSVGPSYTSDIAVDNIEIYTGGCQGVVHNDCTFQHSLCSWHNEGQRLWKRNRGNTPTPGTGPTLDHNNSSLGYYLFVESSRTFPSETARLTSGQVLGNLTGYCLHFWYHMHGENVGMLSVLTTPSDTLVAAGPESTLWQRSGDQGDVWHQQLLYFISPGQQDFEIIFEARLAGGGKEDIAIDDLMLHAGQCETPQLSSH